MSLPPEQQSLPSQSSGPEATGVSTTSNSDILNRTGDCPANAAPEATKPATEMVETPDSVSEPRKDFQGTHERSENSQTGEKDAAASNNKRKHDSVSEVIDDEDSKKAKLDKSRDLLSEQKRKIVDEAFEKMKATDEESERKQIWQAAIDELGRLTEEGHRLYQRWVEEMRPVSERWERVRQSQEEERLLQEREEEEERRLQEIEEEEERRLQEIEEEEIVRRDTEQEEPSGERELEEEDRSSGRNEGRIASITAPLPPGMNEWALCDMITDQLDHALDGESYDSDGDEICWDCRAKEKDYPDHDCCDARNERAGGDFDELEDWDPYDDGWP